MQAAPAKQSMQQQSNNITIPTSNYNKPHHYHSSYSSYQKSVANNQQSSHNPHKKYSNMSLFSNATKNYGASGNVISSNRSNKFSKNNTDYSHLPHWKQQRLKNKANRDPNKPIVVSFCSLSYYSLVVLCMFLKLLSFKNLKYFKKISLSHKKI